MAEVAEAAGASKPLVYHYFSTKRDLYLAAVGAAADELSEATKPDLELPQGARVLKALGAHIDWIDDNALAYRAILQGGISADPDVEAIVEASRADVVTRLSETFGYGELTPARRIALRGWVGYLEGACLDWLATRDLSKAHLARLLAASVPAAVAAADVPDDSEPFTGLANGHPTLGLGAES